MDQLAENEAGRWKSRPEVKVIRWTSCAEFDWLSAACTYAGLRHRRDIVFSKLDLLIIVVDRMEGGPGEHRIEQEEIPFSGIAGQAAGFGWRQLC